MSISRGPNIATDLIHLTTHSSNFLSVMLCIYCVKFTCNLPFNVCQCSCYFKVLLCVNDLLPPFFFLFITPSLLLLSICLFPSVCLLPFLPLLSVHPLSFSLYLPLSLSLSRTSLTSSFFLSLVVLLVNLSLPSAFLKTCSLPIPHSTFYGHHLHHTILF